MRNACKKKYGRPECSIRRPSTDCYGVIARTVMSKGKTVTEAKMKASDRKNCTTFVHS